MRKNINVYKGRANEINLQLYHRGVPLALEGVVRLRMQIIGSTSEVDSAVNPEAIRWNNHGQIKLLLSEMGVIGERGFRIIAYDEYIVDGQVIVSSRKQNLVLRFR